MKNRFKMMNKHPDAKPGDPKFNRKEKVYIATGGERINDFAKRLVVVAQEQGEMIQATFNDTEFFIFSSDDPDEVVKRWFEQRKKDQEND